MTNPDYKYYAFISYKREDEKWAKWLQHKLEHYKLPTSVRKTTPSLPEKARPIFRDTTDLSGGVLAEAIKKALDSSKYLIVICSPRAAQSPWVCKEVQEFIDSGREKYIIPFIIDGEPNSSDPTKECFPKGLNELSGSKELLGININEMGRDAAAIKVVAQMFDLQFDSLWQRLNREKNAKRRFLYIGIFIFVLLSLSIGISFYMKNTQLKKNHGVAIANTAERLIERNDYQTALLLSLEVSPTNNYPYIPKVERVVRTAIDSINTAKKRSFCDYYADREDGKIFFSPNGKFVIIPHNDYAQQGIQQECINLENGKKVSIGGCIQRFVNDSLCYIAFNNGYTGLVQYNNDDFHKARAIRNIKWCGTISPDLQTMVSLKQDTVEIIDLEYGTQKQCIPTKGYLDQAQFNITGDKFLFESNNFDEDIYLCYVYNLKTNIIEMIYPLSTSTELKWISDTKIIAYNKLINNFSILDTDNLKHSEINCEPVYSIEVVPNEDKFVVSFLSDKNKGYLFYYDTYGNVVDSLYVSKNFITDIKIYDDMLAAGNSEGEILIFNRKKSKRTGSYKFHTEHIEQMSFSPDSRYLVSGSYDGTAVVTDLKSKQHYSSSYRIDEDSMVAFSSDDKLLVSGSEYGIIIYNLESGESRKLYVERKSENYEFVYVQSLAISNDCRYIATTSVMIDKNGNFYSDIHLWNLENGSCQYIIPQKHTGSCVFTPDSKYLSVSTFSKYLYLMDLNTLDETYVETKEIDNNSRSFDIGGNQILVSWAEDYSTYVQSVINKKVKSNNIALSIIKDYHHMSAYQRLNYRIENRYINRENYFAICDIATGKEIYFIKSNDYKAIVISTKGDKIAAYNNECCDIYNFKHYDILLDDAKKILGNRELTAIEYNLYFSE